MNAPHPWLAASQNLQAPLVVNRANVSDISSNSANDGHHYIAELSARFICHLFCCVAARTQNRYAPAQFHKCSVAAYPRAPPMFPT
ncbi:hypothetical protein R3P38DRAFT_3231725 [Favolaschia claudopus]|uniref:Uncharacterized protein n=1 Tax=Favolaschia claudopus TaxID=2862362 RepID=A0AAV9ZJW2_9AGAR